MAPIPFPISSAPGIMGQEGAGRLVNCYAESTERGARFPVVWRRHAGLNEIADTGSDTHIHLRGAILVSSTVILVFNTRVYSLTRSGANYTLTNLGALAGSLPVTIAKNNAGTPNIVCVTDGGAFNLFTGSAPTSFADADLPQPNSVCSHDGYFCWSIGDGRFFASDLNAVTVSSSSFTTEQGLVGRRVVSFKGKIFYFGDKWTGVYRNAGTSPFPFERELQIDRGLVGTNAIAGWEPGWDHELIWAADDATVRRLNGYTPERISSPDVERDIAECLRAGDGDLLEATVHVDNGHSFWSLTYPSYWTWQFNQTTSNWSERKSYNSEDWRGGATINALDEWIVGDRTTGKLFAVDPEYYKEGNDALVMTIRSGPTAAFPKGIAVSEAHFDFTAGTGVASGDDPIQTDPTVLVRWSMDGGGSFGSFVSRALGAEGETGWRVRVNRIGISNGKGVVFECQISDPVHVGFLGGAVPNISSVAT